MKTVKLTKPEANFVTAHVASCSQVLSTMSRAVFLAMVVLANDWAVAQTTDGPSAVERFNPVLPQALGTTNPSRGFDSGTRGLSAINPASYSAMTQIVVTTDVSSAPADGQSRVKVTVRLLNASDQAVKDPVIVTIEVSSARILLLDQNNARKTTESGPDAGDIDPFTPGTQVRVEGGEFSFELVAPGNPADAVVRVSAGNLFAAGVVPFKPDLRDLFAVGLVEARLSISRQQLSSIAPIRSNDAFDQELRGFSRSFSGDKAQFGARAAMFLRGTIRGDVLLTMAIDSDKSTREKVFREVDPNAFYPVYGDASQKGNDAQSATRLYVRLDQNRSYLLFGDHNTAGTGSARVLGQYARTQTGLRWHNETAGRVVNAFVSRDAVRQVIDEFSGRGVSGPYSVSNPNGLSNSERVEIVVRDRNQPAVVLRTTSLARFSDYEFEPFSGKILFKAPVPSVDEFGNPVSIRVTYEIEQGGPKFWLTGADAQFKINDRFEVGGSWVRDYNPFAPYRLASVNASAQLAEGTRVLAEVARSEGFGAGALSGSTPASGSAARVELQHRSDDWNARIFAGQSDAGFSNPAASFSGGRTEIGASAAWRMDADTTIKGDTQSSKDRTTGGKRNSLSLSGERKFGEAFTLELGLRQTRETVTPASAGSVGISGLSSSSGYNSGFGIGAQSNGALDPITGLPVFIPGSTIPLNAPNGIPTAPVDLDFLTVRAKLNWKPTANWLLYGEAEQDVKESDRHLLAIGGEYRFAERGRLYARHEFASTLTGSYAINPAPSSQSSVIGVDTTYMKDGQLFNEYRIRDTINGRDAQAAIGIRNLWPMENGLKFSTSAERIQVLSNLTPSALPILNAPRSATALTLGVDYSAMELWKGASRIEWRSDSQTTNWLSTIAVARKINRDWSLLAKNYFNQAQGKSADTGVQTQNRAIIGLAYRDTDTNRSNTLARYELKTERDTAPAIATKRSAHIVSLHSEYHPSRPWWWSGRLAAKAVDERFIGGVQSKFNASLIGGRVVYDFDERFSIGAHLHHLFNSTGRQSAIGTELGVVVQNNMMLTVGYNWRGFSDSDLVNSNYTNRGWVIGLRWKFDLDPQ